ncbi:hypothetical protein CCHR01_12565 [Colletotrichum chrysophilum]|uniref:Uncharacterized protein n=1 Tax=Colletotrichum chrysophilum TaxID=1836956 RepID=A0AAD9ABQ7_9PEZI|nr:hypothetical protein CCHR01_12565 [Colletotrichum chrysophilum]
MATCPAARGGGSDLSCKKAALLQPTPHRIPYAAPTTTTTTTSTTTYLRIPQHPPQPAPLREYAGALPALGLH